MTFHKNIPIKQVFRLNWEEMRSVVISTIKENFRHRQDKGFSTERFIEH